MDRCAVVDHLSRAVQLHQRLVEVRRAPDGQRRERLRRVRGSPGQEVPELTEPTLQHLRRLPLAEVKIDRSFVLGMSTDSDDAAIVGSVVDLGRRLGLRVVAEGVEDDETRRMLVSLGCEVGQGWYFARPMPPDAFAAWIGRYR